MGASFKTWGERVKAVRNHYGDTQEQFAERLSMGVSSVTNWELRSDRPYSAAAERLIELERHLGLSDGS